MSHECKCPAAGFCSTFKRNMSPLGHALCSGALTADRHGRTRQQYLDTWRQQLIDQAQANVLAAPLARTVSDLPLTISIPTRLEAHNTYWTAWQFSWVARDVLDQIEIMIVDNEPDSADGEWLRKKCRDLGWRYEPFTTATGSHLPKQHAMQVGRGAWVLHLDCHVSLPPDLLPQLLAWINTEPDPRNLYMGPLVKGGAKGAPHEMTSKNLLGTHEALVWGKDKQTGLGGAGLGEWAISPEWNGIDSEPFEIPQHGTGLFLAHRDHWPGFPPELHGWGGNETFLMEAYRQRGGKVICLPWLLWKHIFNRWPKGARQKGSHTNYPSSVNDTFRNYLISSLRLGWPFVGTVQLEHGSFAAVLDHWRTHWTDPTVADRQYATFQQEFAAEIYGEQSARWVSDTKGTVSLMVWQHIAANLLPSMRTMEFGSGLSTLLFDRYGTDHMAIESDEKWHRRLFDVIGETERTLISHVPLEQTESGQQWYRSIPLAAPNDLVFIDGPHGGENRLGVLRHLDAIGTHKTIWIVDDVQREPDRRIAETIAKKFGVPLATYESTHGRLFAVVGNARKPQVFEPRAVVQPNAQVPGLVPYQPRGVVKRSEPDLMQFDWPDCPHRDDSRKQVLKCDTCIGRNKPFEARHCTLYDKPCSARPLHTKVTSCRGCIAAGLNQPQAAEAK